jgi:DNA helicase II / ATP-dependent DNA helicase PcrA
VYAARSRFIPDALLTLFQSTTWPTIGTSAPMQMSGSQAPRIDLAAKMRGMWRQKDPANG